jgi:anti-sigma factor RsiW
MTMHYDLETIDDYLHGELDEARDAAVHAHLETCAPCRRAYDETAAIRDWVRAAADAEEREFPALIKARVWETVRAAKPGPLAFLRTGWRPWLGVPVAAALALALYVGHPLAHNGSSPGIAASDLLLEHDAQMADNPLADHGIVMPASTLDSAQPTSALIEAVDLPSGSDPSSDGR